MYLKINQMNKQETKFLENRLKSLLNKGLQSFKDMYFGKYVAWNVAGIESDLEFKTKNNGKMQQIGSKFFTRDYTASIEKLKNRLELNNLLMHEFITAANENYQIKFDRLLSKLMQYEMDTRFLKIENIRFSGSELEFLISNNDMEIHARAIFVHGAIKAPHYRFITTKRNK